MEQQTRKLLIVEDDEGLQSQLRWCFEDYEVLLAEDRSSALAQLQRHEPALVTLDLGLPPDPANATEGLATLEAILADTPDAKVIVVTGNDGRENALKAIELGAYDFYEKPVDANVLRLLVDRAARLYELEQENRRLRQRAESPLQGIITGDPQMLRVCRTIEKVAAADATVLILGDSGTGKELLARAVHDLSERANERFVAINCAAIPENLLESELFGYERGAFTGASKQTVGKIEHANRGTLFLDEIGDLPMALQAKLLRFLQERVVERLGGRNEIPVDVRVVSATHQDLQGLIRVGRFREDLYYRISEISVNIPPLSQRSGDPTLLAHSFLDRYGRQQGRSLRGFTSEALNAIERYPWPGNVRELENVIKRAAILASENRVTADDLGLTVEDDDAEPIRLRQARDEAEYRAIVRALGRCNGNIAQSAELLGVSRPTLYVLLNKYGLK